MNTFQLRQKIESQLDRLSPERLALVSDFLDSIQSVEKSDLSSLTEEQKSRLEWQKFIDETYGSLADENLERPPQLLENTDSSSLHKQPPIKRGKTAKDLLKFAGTWQGDDLESCLDFVRETRSKTQF
ncbi:MAG: hypothetical protein F6K40_18350 [Okeania sp. SIO3I5]|uniref:hypothetical protein n=1 Tax=Okeania sp. SIO3I5 TaxID=2607805 RepID=UPI0013BDBE6D|nr:hypothetical protein [Okeania sp. SIO3I5]NEQ38118.1 hypothetical protein [Okeania sp. SIO3I5]